MRTLKSAFDELVQTLNKYDLYKKEDEVDNNLLVLSCMIDEVENRMECAKRTNIDIKEILFKEQQKIQAVLGYDNEDILQRSVNDIDIVMDLDDNEPMTENWYGLFAPDLKPIESEIVPRETLEPPTYQCKNTHTFDKVKEVIQILKTLDNGDCVDGETMQYILEQVGMEDQMLNQLMSQIN